LANMACAGSPLLIPNASVGTRLEFFSHTFTSVKDPPKLTLCGPFSQFTVFSIRRVDALRDWMFGVGEALVRFSGAPLSWRWKPCWLASEPVNMLGLCSLKNETGA